MSAAPSLVCATEENAPILLVAMCAPVHEATSPALMAPDVWVSLTHINNAFTTFLSRALSLLPPLATQMRHIWLLTSLPPSCFL